MPVCDRVRCGLTVVAVILAFDPAAFKYLAEAKVGRAKADVLGLTKAAETYKNKQGKYPESLKDLAGGGYLEYESRNPLIDPWGNDYQYDPKGARNGGKKPDIWAVMPDGKEIGNWCGG